MKKIIRFLFGSYIRNRARKSVLDRQQALKERIRLVITFNEKKGRTNAVIKCGQYTFVEISPVENDSFLDSVPQLLHDLRVANRHVTF